MPLPHCSSAPPEARVLVVSNDQDIVARVTELLRDARTHVIAHGSDQITRRDTFRDADAALVDVTAAPDPWQVLHPLRRRLRTIIIAALNVRSESEGSAWLGAGADMIISAHGGSSHFETQLKAVARHARALVADRRIVYGDIIYEREKQRVWSQGREVYLTPRELALFDCLFWNAGDTVGRVTLSDFIWEVGDSRADNRIEAYISRVRRKLGPSRRVLIETLRGIGYRLRLVSGAPSE